MSEQDNKRKGLLGRWFGSKAAPQPEPDQPAQAYSADDVANACDNEPAAPDLDIPALGAVDARTQPDEARPPQSSEVHEKSKQSWFQRLKSGLGKTSSKLTTGITGLLTKRKLDGATLCVTSRGNRLSVRNRFVVCPIAFVMRVGAPNLFSAKVVTCPRALRVEVCAPDELKVTHTLSGSWRT